VPVSSHPTSCVELALREWIINHYPRYTYWEHSVLVSILETLFDGITMGRLTSDTPTGKRRAVKTYRILVHDTHRRTSARKEKCPPILADAWNTRPYLRCASVLRPFGMGFNGMMKTKIKRNPATNLAYPKARHQNPLRQTTYLIDH